MTEYTDEKRVYKIEACAESLVKVLKSNKQRGKYLPVFKKELFELTAEHVASAWRKDKYFHTVDGKREIKCPDYKFIKHNWSDIKNACHQLLKSYYVTWDRHGIKIGGEVELTMNLKHLANISKGAVKQHNIEAELSNKRGAAHQFLQVKQLALPGGFTLETA